MNLNVDAAKLPAGLVAAAALVQFAPTYATGPGLLALAVGAFLASTLKLKGAGAAVALVVGAVLFTRITGYGSPGLDQLGQRVPTAAEVSAAVQGFSG